MAEAGERVVALDGLPAGDAARLPDEVPLVRGSSLDGGLLERVLAGKRRVRAAGRAHGIAAVCLRRFDVAGAVAPEPADTGVSDIVPMVFDRLTRGEAPQVFGDGCPMTDGTCVRDCLHVADLAQAHLAAARRLTGPGAGGDLTVNTGRGEGVSVRELITAVVEVTGGRRPPVVEARRPGGAARAVGSAKRAAAEPGRRARRGVPERVSSARQGRLRHRGVWLRSCFCAGQGT
ncbi:hypothetical protein C1I97_08770 [Streptomyces sp. NTH33]|nr:hypothetical protein C1I97_08770 [Streptomyces sp. NTH33]